MGASPYGRAGASLGKVTPGPSQACPCQPRPAEDLGDKKRSLPMFMVGDYVLVARVRKRGESGAYKHVDETLSADG